MRPFLLLEMVMEWMISKDVVARFSTQNEAGLERVNDVI